MSMGMGVVGGVPPVGMNMGNGAGPRGPTAGADKTLLNTYIYDYLLKHGMFESARSLLGEAELQTEPNPRRNSPSRRAQKHDSDGNAVNGIDDNAMDTGEGPSQRKNEEMDEEAKRRGEDLPLPKVPADCPQGSFLFDWWCLFWDIFGARNGNSKNPNAAAYVTQTQATQRYRQEQMLRQMNPQQQQMIMTGQVPSQIMNGQQYNRMMQMQSGAIPNGGMHVQDGVGGGDLSQLQKQNILARQAMMNSNRKTPQQITALKNQQQMMVQAAMQRGEGGEVNDMNGQQPRPQSPAAGQNAGSPNGKRLRLENGGYQEVVGNGRGAPQGAPQGNTASASQAHQLLMANGIDPNRLTPQQFAAFQGQNPTTQQKSIQLYAQSLATHASRTVSALQGVGGPIPKGIPGVQQNPSAHGSPMMPQTSEGTPLGMSDFYATTPGGIRAGGMGAGTGNHALQDYQMQLMLLEQQNKRRLAMARAEQDNIAHHGDGQRRMDQGFSQSMSPSSRAAPSPQPPGNPKMAGTPKMPNQVGPGSPMPDGHAQQRNSPAAMGGFNGQIPQEQQNMMYDMTKSLGINPGGQPNGGAMMRPPSSHPGYSGQMTQGELQQMNANLTLRQAGRGQPLPNAWQQQQQQQVQQQQLQIHQQQQQQAQQQQQQQQQQAQQQQVQQQQAQQAQHQAQQQAQQQQPGGSQAGQPQVQIGTPNLARQNLPGHQAMPPPSAPPGAPNNVRTQPSSPQVPNQQPPTPTQSHKPNPKGKAARDTSKKQRPNKKNGSAAPQPPNPVTPSSEPPTPTTPSHPNSFAHPRPTGFANTPGQGGNAAGQPPQQPTPNPAHAAPPAPVAGPPDAAPSSFSTIGEELNLTFTDFADNGETLLDNFDFDSFLNTEDSGGIQFDNALGWGAGEGVETGAGES